MLECSIVIWLNILLNAVILPTIGDEEKKNQVTVNGIVSRECHLQQKSVF